MARVARPRRALGGLVAVIALSACSVPAQEPSTTTMTATATATGGMTSAPVDTPTAVPLGQPVEVAMDGAVLRLTLESVAVVTECPGRAAPVQQPVFGHFVVLHIAASVTESYAPVGAELFRITAPDGRTQSVSSTDASWACFEPAELLPAFVDAGEPVSGVVVLDSATEHGTVSYNSPGGANGWFWSF